MSHEPMHRIIRLKRYEQPPAGYHENFLREFHHRQRAELLKPSLLTLLQERIASVMHDFRVPVLAYAGASVVAVAAGVAILKFNPTASSGPASSYAVSYTPVTIQKMQPVSLRTAPSPAPMSFSTQLPATYLLQARPASHESPLSF